MKTYNIIFFCGSLEPGKDGVGDYTRRLAGALQNQGTEVGIIALYDQFISDIIEGCQDSEGIKIPCLRIPSIFDKKNADIRIKAYIASRKPDWFSLQLVLYAYHKKGLPFNLGKRLSAIGKGKRWHIMFHELWIGWAKHDTLKHFLVGTIQKRLVKKLVNTLEPALIQTQTHIYQEKLQALGWRVEFLPLFSNIPMLKGNRSPIDMDAEINMVIFGGVHPYAPVEPFVKEVSEYALVHSKQLALTLIGRNGIEAQKWIEQFKRKGIPVGIFGEQPVQKISEILGNSTIGITTTPMYLIEKSGSVAAMRQHSLPIICVSRPWMPDCIKSLKTPEDILYYKLGNLKELNTLRPCASKEYEVSEVAKQFLLKLDI